jgi:hypothetical protein
VRQPRTGQTSPPWWPCRRVYARQYDVAHPQADFDGCILIFPGAPCSERNLGPTDVFLEQRKRKPQGSRPPVIRPPSSRSPAPVTAQSRAPRISSMRCRYLPSHSVPFSRPQSFSAYSRRHADGA